MALSIEALFRLAPHVVDCNVVDWGTSVMSQLSIFVPQIFHAAGYAGETACKFRPRTRNRPICTLKIVAKRLQQYLDMRSRKDVQALP